MKLKVETIDTWAAPLEDRPGALAAKLDPLAKAGVNLQFVIARLIHRLRPWLPTEVAGFAMLMSGLNLGLIGFTLLTGVSAA